MASSSDDQQPPKSSDRPPSPPPPSSSSAPPPIYPHPPNGPYNHPYPHAMGYPPPPHPGYPPAPGPYPPNYNPYHPYAQAPPAAYYNNTPHHNYPPDTVSAGFIRGIIAALILLVLLMTLSSIITWLVLRPEIPTFRVGSFSVRNFNISKSNYSGNWDADVTVHNPNQKLDVNFERIQSFVDFKDNTLAMSFAEPFFLDVGKSSEMRVKCASSSPDEPGDWAGTEADMASEKAAGPVGFNLRFFVWTTFRSGSWWKKRVVMRVFCEDVKIVFAGAGSGNGAFAANGNPKDCSVLV